VNARRFGVIFLITACVMAAFAVQGDPAYRIPALVFLIGGLLALFRSAKEGQA
jgi:hypothetical protein